VAAGSLMITEAGGLIGNFTGESDYLYQREVVAGCPKIYGQLVHMLSPYTRVIKGGDESHEVATAPAVTPESALAAALVDSSSLPAAPKRASVRVRKPSV
jgi:myo-inositol-1(or 4)-monophosphatase